MFSKCVNVNFPQQRAGYHLVLHTGIPLHACARFWWRPPCQSVNTNTILRSMYCMRSGYLLCMVISRNKFILGVLICRTVWFLSSIHKKDSSHPQTYKNRAFLSSVHKTDTSHPQLTKTVQTRSLGSIVPGFGWRGAYVVGLTRSSSHVTLTWRLRDNWSWKNNKKL